ncbi:MAG: glycosyltransferase family 2 protein [Nitrospira sp.]|nr:glycosyltransferase family 2 protein [Nitrospira sp.]
MTNPRPLVSICVPTYNRAHYLSQSLRTIRAIAYEPLEIILSDNGSTDATEAVCLEAAQADPRIRYFRHPVNRGAHPNYNFCFDQAAGDILCFFHDDDLYEPDIVSQGVAFLQAHPEVGIVSSDWRIVDSAGAVVGAREFAVAPVIPGLEFIDQTIRSGQCCVGCPGAMIRRSALGTTRFDEAGNIGFGDFVVWFRIAERAAIGHIPPRLFSYRIHTGSLSQRTLGRIARDYHDTLNLYCDEHLARWPQHAEMVARWRTNISRYLFWALAYEVGLHVRPGRPPVTSRSGYCTVFEIANYRLTPEEFRHVLEQMRRYRTGFTQHVAFAIIEALLRMQITWPLGWVTRYPCAFRGILGLR